MYSLISGLHYGCTNARKLDRIGPYVDYFYTKKEYWKHTLLPGLLFALKFLFV